MKLITTIAIMAAGLGSRFGGQKQLHPISPNNYSILDYSIYDAIEVGFNTIILIVNEDNLNRIKAKYNQLETPHISISYIIQDKANLPKEYQHVKRDKPWGTGHALLSLKHHITSNFALINADDFYGKEAFQLMYNALYNLNTSHNYFIAYVLENTLSENGAVSRGECFVDKDSNSLLKIVERTNISRRNHQISYFDRYNDRIDIESKTIVSMNFWGLTPEVFAITDALFNSFLKDNYMNQDAEFYIPKIVNYAIKYHKMSFKMKTTNVKWCGITYAKDQELVTEHISNLTKKGIYPTLLW